MSPTHLTNSAFHARSLQSNKSLLRAARPRCVRHSFKFASILPPSSAYGTSLIATNAAASKNNLLVKQSYLLFTWISYIQDPASRTSVQTTDDTDASQLPSFFIHKKSTSKHTYIKAPMAHKTFSQEQFVYQTYSISISFKSKLETSQKLDSINKCLYAALSIRHSFAPIETNLFFMKKVTMSFLTSDLNFMRLK
jgi:hypothetical protein